jgi:hypothetical protein
VNDGDMIMVVFGALFVCDMMLAACDDVTQSSNSGIWNAMLKIAPKNWDSGFGVSKSWGVKISRVIICVGRRFGLHKHQ